MKVLLSPEAAADLQATLEFIRSRNAGAALSLAQRVFATLTDLAVTRVDGPEHQLTTGECVRSWLVTPFRIYYQRRDDALHVLRI